MTAYVRHPITAAEILYQERSIAMRGGWRLWRWLKRAWLALSVFSVLFFALLRLSALFFPLHLDSLAPEVMPLAFVLWLLLPGFVLLPTVTLLHFGLLLRTLLWAGSSIAREKQNGTWELLLLTGVPARTLVLGKWWATVRRAFPAYVRLWLLRGGLLLWLLELRWMNLSLSPRFSMTFNSDSGDRRMYELGWLLLGLLLLGLLTQVNLLVTAGLGTAAAFFTRRGAVNAALAGVLRSVILSMPLALALLWSIFVVASYPAYTSGGYYGSAFQLLESALLVAGVTLFDNGLFVNMSLVIFKPGFPGSSWQDAVMYGGSVLFALLSYGLLLSGSLWLARGLARRQGALAQEKGGLKTAPLRSTRAR
ncbi:MAG: hypothetical protein HXY40_18620 [Chloroflexi bacterium]|nr:hypothetical protein [Chloroflexota bacterium]